MAQKWPYYRRNWETQPAMILIGEGGNMGEPSNTRGNVDKTMGFNGFNGIEWHFGGNGIL